MLNKEDKLFLIKLGRCIMAAAGAVTHEEWERDRVRRGAAEYLNELEREVEEGE